jgi:hypothetical protein
MQDPAKSPEFAGGARRSGQGPRVGVEDFRLADGRPLISCWLWRQCQYVGPLGFYFACLCQPQVNSGWSRRQSQHGVVWGRDWRQDGTALARRCRDCGNFRTLIGTEAPAKPASSTTASLGAASARHWPCRSGLPFQFIPSQWRITLPKVTRHARSKSHWRRPGLRNGKEVTTC